MLYEVITLLLELANCLHLVLHLTFNTLAFCYIPECCLYSLPFRKIKNFECNLCIKRSVIPSVEDALKILRNSPGSIFITLTEKY